MTTPPPAGADLTPPVVLLIEDDRDTLDGYSMFFESAGMCVATATSPAEGRTHARELHPNLIVTDVSFGGQQVGVDFVHAIKTDSSTRDIPVIVLSGTPAEDLPANTREEADLVLLKPVSPDIVLERSRELIAVSSRRPE